MSSCAVAFPSFLVFFKTFFDVLSLFPFSARPQDGKTQPTKGLRVGFFLCVVPAAEKILPTLSSWIGGA